MSNTRHRPGERLPFAINLIISIGPNMISIDSFMDNALQTPTKLENVERECFPITMISPSSYTARVKNNHGRQTDFKKSVFCECACVFPQVITHS